MAPEALGLTPENQQSTGPDAVRQAEAAGAAKAAELIAQEAAAKAELGAVPGKAFITNQELQQVTAPEATPATPAISTEQMVDTLHTVSEQVVALQKEVAASTGDTKTRLEGELADAQKRQSMLKITLDDRRNATAAESAQASTVAQRTAAPRTSPLIKAGAPGPEIKPVVLPDLGGSAPAKPEPTTRADGIPAAARAAQDEAIANVRRAQEQFAAARAQTTETAPVPAVIPPKAEAGPSEEPPTSSAETPSAASLARTGATTAEMTVRRASETIPNTPREVTDPNVITVSPEASAVSEQPVQNSPEQFDTLQQDLITMMAEQGVTVAMYRQGDKIRADYTDENGKRIGLETIQTLFGDEMPKVAETVGKLEALAYTNPELFATRESARERTARLASGTVDRLGGYLRSKAPDLKGKGLWATARQWFNRGKARAAAAITGFQAKADELQRQRSEKRVAANFQKFASTFNLMTPDMIRANKTAVKLAREIDAGIDSQEYDEATGVATELAKKIDRLKIMDARLGRIKEIRSLEKRRDNFQKQVNMLRGQLAKLSTSFNAVDQELKQQQALEHQSLADQLRAKNPAKPNYVGPEIPDRAPATASAEARTPYVGPEIDEPSSTNAPDDRTTPMGTRQPYYSQEQEMSDTLNQAAAENSTTTDVDRAAADTVDTSVAPRTIPLGPPAAKPEPVPDAAPTPPPTPEAQTGEGQ